MSSEIDAGALEKAADILAELNDRVPNNGVAWRNDAAAVIRAYLDAASNRADATPFFAESAKNSEPAAMPGVEAAPDDPTREYIPLPGGWEVQTKGAGSSYRLLDKKTGERHLILSGKDWLDLQTFFTRMAKEVHSGALTLAQENERLKARVREISLQALVDQQQAQEAWEAQKAAEQALREIAEQDVTEIALDPDWPRRIAASAIRASAGDAEKG